LGDEFVRRALGKVAVLVDGVLVVQRAHLVVVVAVGGGAVGADQLVQFLLVEQALKLAVEIKVGHSMAPVRLSSPALRGMTASVQLNPFTGIAAPCTARAASEHSHRITWARS